MSGTHSFRHWQGDIRQLARKYAATQCPMKLGASKGDDCKVSLPSWHLERDAVTMRVAKYPTSLVVVLRMLPARPKPSLLDSTGMESASRAERSSRNSNRTLPNSAHHGRTERQKLHSCSRDCTLCHGQWKLHARRDSPWCPTFQASAAQPSAF
jgi:hypothetical protein